MSRRNTLNAVFRCIDCDDFDELKRLVDSGAEYNGENRQGETPLILSCRLGDEGIPMVNYFLSLPDVDPFKIYRCRYNALYAAVASGSLSLVESILATVVPVENIPQRLNMRQLEGCTAFFACCQCGHHMTIGKYLLANGADINIPDEDGTTSLMSAVACKKNELFQFLIDNGADLFAKNKIGGTALDLAVKFKPMHKILFEKMYPDTTKLKKDMTLCTYCLNEGKLLKCVRCKNAAYCNSTCQAAHWPAHKPNCKKV